MNSMQYNERFILFLCTVVKIETRIYCGVLKRSKNHVTYYVRKHIFQFANCKVIGNLYTKDVLSFYFVFINFLYWYKCNVLTCVKYFVSHRFIKLFPFTINLKYLTQYSILMHPEIFLLLSINWFCILMTDNLCFSVHFLYIHF